MLLLSPLGQDTRVSGHTTPLRRTDTQSISHRLPAPSLIGIVVTIARRRTDDGRRASPPGRADTNTLSPSRTQTSSAVRSSGAQPLRPHSLGTISAPPSAVQTARLCSPYHTVRPQQPPGATPYRLLPRCPVRAVRRRRWSSKRAGEPRATSLGVG